MVPHTGSTLSNTIKVEESTPYKIGNANLKASIQNVRLYIAFTGGSFKLYNSWIQIWPLLSIWIILCHSMLEFPQSQPKYSVTVVRLLLVGQPDFDRFEH